MLKSIQRGNDVTPHAAFCRACALAKSAVNAYILIDNGIEKPVH